MKKLLRLLQSLKVTVLTKKELKEDEESTLFGKIKDDIFWQRVRRFIFKTFHAASFAIKDLNGVTKKPLRHASHISILVAILLILASSSFSVVMVKSEKLLDPMGANKLTESEIISDKNDELQVAATLASIVDENLAEDAFKIATEAQLNASYTLPVLASSAIYGQVETAQSGAESQKELFRKYIVQNGDTLWTIARVNDLTVDTIRWANGLTDIDNVKPGDDLLIPSTVGVLYTVKGGETIAGIASRYGVSAALIESYNNIIDEEIKPGLKIMIPDGVGPELSKPEPRQATRLAAGSNAPSFVSSSSGPNRFPWGYCTYYVASRRNIPWNGNAWQWYGNGIAYGRSVGKTPVAGSVMVTWESPVGHVAYVESVNGNTFTVSEMNFVGYGRVSRRTITVGEVPLIGFVY